MLSESVLKDLASPTPLREHLVKTAWPSLSTEAKLQLIDAHRSDVPPMFHYLYELAASDPQPIVRYWGLRHAHLPDPDQPDEWTRQPELEAAKLARADSCELVRALEEINRKSGLLGTQLGELSSHTARLVAIRTDKDFRFHSLVEFLKETVEVGTIPAEELGECLWEFARSPSFRRYDPDDRSPDWYGYMQEGEALETVWDIASKAEDSLAQLIAMFAPLRAQGRDIDVQSLAKLRGRALEKVLHRHPEPAAQRLRDHILANPEQFAEDTVKTAQFLVEWAESRSRFSAEDVREYAIKHSCTDGERTLHLVEALREELRAVRTELAQMREQAVARATEPAPEPTRKRRPLFG